MTYAIIPTPTDDADIWRQVVQEPDSARKSLNGWYCVVKWEGETPPSLKDVPTLTAEEVSVALASPAWSAPLPWDMPKP